ncbi:uncharacterized protein RHOBADRAFT_66347, partial [Rhodotorula graminis WP1]
APLGDGPLSPTLLEPQGAAAQPPHGHGRHLGHARRRRRARVRRRRQGGAPAWIQGQARPRRDPLLGDRRLQGVRGQDRPDGPRHRHEGVSRRCGRARVELRRHVACTFDLCRST